MLDFVACGWRDDHNFQEGGWQVLPLWQKRRPLSCITTYNPSLTGEIDNNVYSRALMPDLLSKALKHSPTVKNITPDTLGVASLAIQCARCRTARCRVLKGPKLHFVSYDTKFAGEQDAYSTSPLRGST